MKTKLHHLCILLALFAGVHQAAAQIPSFPITTPTNVLELEIPGGVASSGSNYLVGIGLNDTNVCLQLASSNGVMIGSLFTVGASEGEPRLAFGKTNYLAFWGDDYISGAVDLYGQLVSSSGAKVGSAFPLVANLSLATTGFQAEQAIAFDGTNFLVVWEYETESSSAFYGQLVTPAGALSGSEFLIGSTVTGSGSNPSNDEKTALAFGTTNYLFVWQIKASDTPEEWSTFGAFISRSGSVSGSFAISQTNSPSYNPLSVAFDGTNYLAVWNRDTGPGYPSPTMWNIDARLVSPNGTFPGNELTLATNQAITPSIAFDGANYLLNWIWSSQTNSTTQFPMFYQFLNRSASPIGPAFTIFPLGTNNFGLNNVIFGGNKFLAGAALGTAMFGANGNPTNFLSIGVEGAFIPASTTPPTLTASNLVGTQFPLQLTGTPGINYAILFSTNLALSNWTAVVTNSLTNGVFSFTDNHATNASRFYRAVKQ
jgi:hypothetical protein